MQGGLAQVPAPTKGWLPSPRVLREVPGQDWGSSGLFGEAEGLCGDVSVLEAAREFKVTNGLGLQLLC